jgi:rod shape determining protein RodA
MMFGFVPSFVIVNKLRDFNWGFLLVMVVIALVGFAALFSVADGHADPWAKAQMIRFAIGLGIMAVVAMVDLRIWMALAYPLYLLALLLLVAVDLFGTVGMGAQRWLAIGPLTIQPSEIMKISLVLALARYYHGLRPESVSHFFYLIPPAIMVGLPVGLVAVQPDLGTALLLTAGSALLIFIAGLSWRIIFLIGGLGLAAIPVAWGVLHDYQRDRVYTFLDPSRDPMGAGYHITQSKIALGSGGIFGKGYMQGTQSHLNFLPEKQTDFIFTMYGEEWGFIGCVALLILYLVLLGYGLSIAQRSRSHFGRLMAMGILSTFLLYILINTAMVMGLVPVVGVPLPLVSYGGTAMMTMMFGFGLIMCVHLHRQTEIPRYPGLFL